MNPMLTAFICVIMYLLMRRLRFDGKTAVLTVCVFGIFTPAFPYAKNSFDVVSTSFLYVFALYTVLRFRQSSHCLWVVLSGVLLGFALLTRITTLLLLPFFVFYILIALREQKQRTFYILNRLFLFLIPVVATVLFIAWYNTLRFGVFYEDGHSTDAAVKLTTPVIVGLIGQLVSPGKGLFIYSPILLFSFFGIRRCYERFKWEAILIFGVIVVNVLFHSKLVNWSGDWCWGPRFCLLFVPFLCILIGCVIDSKIFDRHRLLRKLWMVFLLLSLSVQILGVTIDGSRRIGNRFTSGSVTPSELYWHPLKSPIIDHAKLLCRMSNRPVPRYSIDAADSHLITYDDATADFWFVYLYSLGFPLILILFSIGFMIFIDIYCARIILCTIRTEDEMKC